MDRVSLHHPFTAEDEDLANAQRLTAPGEHVIRSVAIGSLLVALAMTGPAQTFPQPPPPNHLRIVTQNLESFDDRSAETIGAERDRTPAQLDALAQRLNGFEATVVALQEMDQIAVLNDLRNRMVSSLVLASPDASRIPSELFNATWKTTRIEAFQPTPLFDRHDPSNIIRHEDRYWVFYTRNHGNHREVSVQVASSVDGFHWTDIGEAIGRGAPGSWDESGAIAPYVVSHEGKFHLFYTGFRDSNLATRELGCAIADHPIGPWIRWHGNPILQQDPDPSAWDSGMLGDSNVIFREGKWWLYFKSRRDAETNKDTRIGVAVADQITGPYRKHPGNPLFAGHAFSAWLHRDGVAALCGTISTKIKWSRDGLHFEDAGELPNQSTGLFTPDVRADRDHRHGFDWGLEVYAENGSRGLWRFDCEKREVSANPSSASLPNIVFIMADDLGYGDLGCYGQKLIQTPRIDRMAAEGTRFTHCYAGAPVCAPSRSVLMTGQHTGHTRVRDNSGRVGGAPDEMSDSGDGHRIPLWEEDVTIAEVLKKAGYVTGITGKWGLGEAGTSGEPNRQGFDEWYGYLNQNHAVFYYTDYLWHDGKKEFIEANKNNARQKYTHDLFTEFALDFIRRHRQQPFFLYVPYTIPHFNLEVPSLEPYADQDWPEKSKIFAAMITRMDRDVGRILDLLKELGLEENTLVFFTSDNGSPEAGGPMFNSNGVFTGKKGTLQEGGLRAPMVVRWPGKVPAGRVSDAPWYFADVMPTLAELAGATPPKNIDGVSIVPTFLGKPQDLTQRFLYWERPSPKIQQAARFGHWKAVRTAPGQRLQLFDLATDPREELDSAASQPERVARFETYFENARTESPHWPRTAKHTEQTKTKRE